MPRACQSSRLRFRSLRTSALSQVRCTSCGRNRVGLLLQRKSPVLALLNHSRHSPRCGSKERIHADALFNKIIKPAFASVKKNVHVVRADHIATPGIIDSQIVTHLIEARNPAALERRITRTSPLIRPMRRYRLRLRKMPGAVEETVAGDIAGLLVLGKGVERLALVGPLL
jgi:hypothetical protein